MWIHQGQRERWMVRLIALLTGAMGMINLVSATQPAFADRFALLANISPLEVTRGSHFTAALAGFALLVLSFNLWRRKKMAWRITVLTLVISIFAHLLKGLDYEEASLALGLLILLILFRYSFHAESDQPSVRQGLFVLGASLAFTLLYGTIGFYLLDRHFSVHFSLWGAVSQTVVMFTSFYNPGLPLTGFGRYFVDSIYIIGLVTLGFALFMLIRPVLLRQPATPEERARAKTVVEAHGRTALARSTLFEDKSYFFGPGESVIAYAVRRRGALALGDPIGPSADVDLAIPAFQKFCSRNDWSPAFVSTLPDYLASYQKAGFDVVCIGYEAIVVLEKFSLEGSQNKGLRNTVSRMERSGFRAEVFTPPLDDKLLLSLRHISDAWLTLRKGGEMHFSDGWFEDDYIRNGPVIVIYGADGNPTAFANLVPEYQKNELGIDLMRHYPQVENGTMEFLFTRMFQWAREKGYETFSLGLSAIVGVGEKPEDTRVEQALHTISEYISRFYNFRGLHNFKDKFHPRWEPRYLVYQGAASLPLVLNTLLLVHSGNNFLWKFLKK